MKKISLTLIMSFMAVLLTGCYMGEYFTYNDNGIVDVEIKTGYSEEEVGNADKKELEKLNKEVINGQIYYTTSEVKSFTKEELAEDNIYFTKGVFRANSGDIADSSGYDENDMMEGIVVEIRVNMGEEIVDTNGKIMENGTTVSFMKQSGSLYAYTKSGMERIKEDKTAPEIIGIKNGAYYGKNVPGFGAVDDVAVSSLTVNGISGFNMKSVKSGKVTYYDAVKNGKSIYKRNSKNIIRAVDTNGNETVVEFYIDTKKPVVKGIKNKKTYNGKVTFYALDKMSGIKAVKANGKKIKGTAVKKGKYKNYKKYVLKKKGKNKIAVTDKTDNKATYNITIR